MYQVHCRLSPRKSLNKENNNNKKESSQNDVVEEVMTMAMRRQQHQEEEGGKRLRKGTGVIYLPPTLSHAAGWYGSIRERSRATKMGTKSHSPPCPMPVNSLTDGKTFFRHIRPQASVINLCLLPGRERDGTGKQDNIWVNLGRIFKAL